MDPNLTTAIVTASATALVAIVALVQNSKRFDEIGKRIDDFNRRFEDFNKRFEDLNKRFEDFNKRFDYLDSRIGRVETRLDLIQSDLKEFYRIHGELEKRVQRLEDKQ